MANSKEAPSGDEYRETPEKKERISRPEEKEKRVEKAKEKEKSLSEEDKIEERKKAIRKSVEEKAPEVEQEEVEKQEKEMKRKGGPQKHFEDLATQNLGKALGSVKKLSAYEMDEVIDKLCEKDVFEKLLRAGQIDYPSS